MSKEKEYIFWEGRGMADPRCPHKIIVKESELTQAQRALLYGDLVNKFNNLPNELQYKFINDFLKEFMNIMENRMLEELAQEALDNQLQDLMDSEEFLNMPGDEED